MAQLFKLKGVTSLDLRDGEKREVEVEGVENGKALLLKVPGQDQVHATSANCTHYGAPLKMGVLTPEGRLTCPWHGACFSVATGDVEDAPALDPLAKYELVEKDGAVYIKTEEAILKANRRHLNIKCSASVLSNEKLLVIGGGSGTLGTIEGLRGGGYTGHITVLSKAAWRPADFYKDASIDIIQDEVKSVDFGSRTVSTVSGKTYDYTKLVLATGGTPRWLPLPGLKEGELDNVFVLRALPDAQKILKAVGDNGKKIVVIGSSFIGMEVGNCLASMKNDVTIVGMEKAPMERVMGAKIGAVFRKLLEKNGVKFYMEAGVDKAVPSKEDPSKVGAVYLKDGTVLEADLVIEGVGVAPATEYLKTSGITLEKDGSISTDESFAVKGLQDVYAIGDIATFPYHGPGGNGNPIRIEHWNVAQNAGRSVANSINNPGAKPKPFIPVFWSALGAQLRYCGNTVGGYDDVVVTGDLDKPSFIAYYTQGETVVAVASMMKDPYMTQSAELMRRAKMPSKSELQKGVDILQIDVPSEIKM